MLEGEECLSSQYAPCYKVRNIQVVSILEGEECLGSQYAGR